MDWSHSPSPDPTRPYRRSGLIDGAGEANSSKEVGLLDTAQQTQRQLEQVKGQMAGNVRKVYRFLALCELAAYRV